MDPDCVDAWREPGSPIGLGEIQVVVAVIDGVKTQLRNEVIAYEEGRRAVAELEGSRPDMRMVSETVIAPDADGDEVEVVHRAWLTLPPGSPQALVAQNQQHLDTWAQAVDARLPDYCGRPRTEGGE